jgi:DNA-binding NtrC family response regulator
MVRRRREAPADELHLLLVEDDQAVAFALSGWLAGQGARVAVAASVRESREMVGDAAFVGLHWDGLLSDYWLPDATGHEVVTEFRRIFPGVPLALITACDELRRQDWPEMPIFQKPPDTEALRGWLARKAALLGATA